MTGAEPRWWTKPTAGAQHDGRRVEAIAQALGTPLMPWQQLVARVGTERDAENPSRYRYRVVIVSVPRQSGKTTLLRSVACERTLAWPDLQAFYTAQTGKDARERWRDMVRQVERSPLQPFARLRFGAGSESLAWPNGSEIRTFAPVPSALHGYTPPLVMLDEAWEYDESLGEALEGAIFPAQVTIAHRQLWIVSTMGDAASTWFHRWIERGREATADPSSRVAMFEWSAADGVDLYSPEAWRSWHPALGHTITEDTLAEEANNNTPGTWQRAFGNRRTRSREAIVDLDRWTALADLELAPPARDEVALAFSVAHDRSQASIVAGWLTESGPRIRVVQSALGTAWLVPALTALADEWGVGFTADDGGPEREFAELARRAGIAVETLNGREYAAACGGLLRHVMDGTLRWDGTDVLNDAMEAAVLRPMGDSVALSRRHSRGPIDALVAGAVAMRQAALAPLPAPAPQVAFA